MASKDSRMLAKQDTITRVLHPNFRRCCLFRVSSFGKSAVLPLPPSAHRCCANELHEDIARSEASLAALQSRLLEARGCERPKANRPKVPLRSS